MKNSSSRWLAVTAGVGSSHFEDAAFRVRDTLKASGIVDEVVAVTTKDLPSICPKTTKLYREIMNAETRGFGYMCWKAEIVNAAIEGVWGDYQGIIWIDAGCEIALNPISMIRFRAFKKYAMGKGVACFSLDTLEVEYTKRDIFELFPAIDPFNSGHQIQTTWFFLYGEIGKKISREWLSTVLVGANILNLEPSSLPEYASFIENRYDQSTFSMVCKNNQITPMNYVPTTGHGTTRSIINGFFHPIWTSRNRVGKSVKTKLHKLFEKPWKF